MTTTANTTPTHWLAVLGDPLRVTQPRFKTPPGHTPFWRQRGRARPAPELTKAVGRVQALTAAGLRSPPPWRIALSTFKPHRIVCGFLVPHLHPPLSVSLFKGSRGRPGSTGLIQGDLPVSGSTQCVRRCVQSMAPRHRGPRLSPIATHTTGTHATGDPAVPWTDTRHPWM